jgi:TonB-dependent starch-binding outer membrane protein SusC
LNENTLNYNVTLSDNHRLDFVGGITFQSYMNRFISVGAEQFANNTISNFDLGSGGISFPASNGISEWKLLSGLVRANYAYDDRYLATISFRSDGSSRFGETNKWAFFPSAALAWRISSESFMENVNIINDFKLRASYGRTGNTALNPYQSLSRLGSQRTVFGGNNDIIGFTPVNIANPDLKWETTDQMDVGFDLSLFDGRLGFTFDYYKKITSDLLASVPLPTSSGYNSVLRNIGEVHNDGIELSVNYSLFRSEFSWNVSGHYTNNNNEVASLAGGSDILGSGLGNPYGSTGINIAREGEPFGAFYGFREDGIDPETGQRIIRDVNEDGITNALDRVVIGSPHSDFIFGLNNSISYMNFGLDVFVNGAFGHDVFWSGAAQHTNSFQRGHNQLADVFGNYWTEENPNNAKYPKVSSETFVLASDDLLFDASYLRVKTVTLSYNFPVGNIDWFSRAQIYITADNLLTITNFPGIDPEVNTYGTDTQNVGQRLRTGIAGTVYPSARTFMIGTKLDF